MVCGFSSAPSKAQLMAGQHTPPLQIAAAKPRSSRKWWIWIAVLVVLAAGAYFLWPKISGAKSTAGAAPAALPVVAATVRKGDIGVYYSGLGAVTPLATVTVRTRVDGQLMSVRYREGDTVQEGRSAGGN